MDFSKHVLIFPHIPKTAGSSVGDSIVDTLGADRCHRLRMQKIENPRSSRAAELGVLAHEFMLKTAGHVTGRHYLLSKRTSPEAIGSARFLWGHFRIGEEPDTGRRPRYITVVRDPVDRFLSYFHYRRDQLPTLIGNKTKHPLLDDNGEIPSTPMAYLEMLERRSAKNWQDPQVRYFSPEGTFEAAREVIEGRDIRVGSVANLGSFLNTVADDLGIEEIKLEHKNKGRSRSKAREELSADEKARISQYFSEDRKLYDYVIAETGDG